MFIPMLVASNIWEELVAEMAKKGKVTGVTTLDGVGDGGGVVIIPAVFKFADRDDILLDNGEAHRICLSLYSAKKGGSLGEGGDKKCM